MLCSSIILHILEELRRDRKIKMILMDRGIEKYIKLDITDINFDTLTSLD